MNWLKQGWIKVLMSVVFLGILFLLITNNKLGNTIHKQSPTISQQLDKNQNEPPEENIFNLTDEEIYNNPFVRHIRIALNGYLDGSNKGIEDDSVINGMGEDTNNLNCGLSKFDKSYYKSKFIIWNSEPNKYGGMATDIVFIDKPDTIFWAWVYQYHNEGSDYILRGFCEDGPKEEFKVKFPDMIKAMVKDGKFPYSL